MNRLHLACGLVYFAGCASTGAIPVGQDTYMLSKQSATGFQSAVGIRADVLKEANEFASSKGRVMVIRSLISKDGVPGRSYATVELVFKTVRPDDPEAASSIERGPDTIIERRSR